MNDLGNQGRWRSQAPDGGANYLRPRSYLAIALLGLALLGCRNGGDEPAAVTQVAMVGGQEVVVTRVVRRTVEVQATPVVEPPDRPVILDLSFSDDYDTLDPQRTADENAITVIENVFAGLTRYNHQTATIEPQLAERWESSSDGKTWTFHLRDDIFWMSAGGGGPAILGNGQVDAQPLRPVTADDVVFAIQRICDPRVETPDAFIFFIIEGCEQVNRQVEIGPEDLDSIGVEATGDTTVRIRLNEPAGYFLTMTTLWQMRPVPVEDVLALDEEWTLLENIVTSGPFVLSPQSVAGARTVLQRNPYWPIPFSGNVDVVNILHLDADADAFALWEERNLDLSPVPAADEADILAHHSLKFDLVPNQAVFYLGYNFDSPAFRELEVRRAFSWAIDRERLVEEVYGARALPMRHFAPPGTLGAPRLDEVGMGYNPDRARQQMDASTFTDCRLMPPITYMVSSSDLALQQAQLIRDMWIEELGCKEEQITIQQVQFGTLLAETQPDAGRLRPDMWDLGWIPYYPDEQNWVGDVLHCNQSENRQRRPCSQVDSVILEAGGSADQQQRLELYRQVERDFFGEEAIEPVSPLLVRADPVLRQTWVTYTPAPFGGEQYDTYYIDPALKELERLR